MTNLEEKNIDLEHVELFVVRAIKKKCYLEVISLGYTIIELYLQSKLIKYIQDLHEDEDIINNPEKWNILIGEKNLNKIATWSEICLLLKIIDVELYKKIKRFNSERNGIIHTLLIQENEGKQPKNYKEVKNTAKLGREIQLRLSPFAWTEEKIQQVLYYFDHPEEAPSDDVI